MSGDHACLIVVDESPEFPAAMVYAALFAKSAGWRLIMLRVNEPAEPAPWATVTEEIRRQAVVAAENLAQRFSAEVWAECGLTPIALIREGELKPEVRKVIDEDASIKTVILAAATGSGGPGPLVSSLAKGQGLAGRPVPVVVVPGALTKDEVRALALPMAAAAAPAA